MLTNSNELLGQALGTCTLKRLIGRGGMGAVYLAQQSRPRRVVAVKVLLPHLIDTRPREEFLARFRREADAIAALDHINIMPIYEYGEQREAAFLVMPYVTGGTLRERLEAQAIPPIQNTVTVAEQVAAGLDSAHALGIIHRDLKPGNILFHADGRILIADFGLAKILTDAAEQDSGARVLTSAGSIIGTPEYLSPEQGTGNPTDYRTDIYSLGVVLYQMLAGRVPFLGTTPVAVAIKHALKEPPLITQFNPAIPHSVEAVVMKALAKAPEQRFASAGEFARALRLAISNESATMIWTAPDQTPAVTTTPATDSPKLVEPAQDNQDQDNAGKENEGKEDETKETKDIEEENSRSDHDVENKVSSQADPTHQVPQEGVLTTLPTVLIGPDGDELHNALTWQESSTDKQVKAKPTFPAEGMPEEKQFELKAFHQEVELPAFLRETEQPQSPPAPANGLSENTTQPRPPVWPTPEVAQRHRQARLQPIWKMLMGGFLTLLIIIGGLAAYTHLLPTSSTPKNVATPIHQTTSTPLAQNQTPTATPSPAVIQPAIQAGTQIYGTQQPFAYCDKQGGHWDNTPNGLVTCNSGGSQIANTSGHLVPLNLNQIPTNQSLWPSQNFVVQVNVTINPNSQGAFGVAFPTGNSPQEYFTFLLNQPNGWTFNHYNSQGTDTLAFGTLLSPMPTQFTLDVRVEGTSYTFFINGQDTTAHAEIGSQFINKTVGLAVDANANVTFSNFAIYAL